ncbi:MAG TPA: hypothetical protein VEY12_04350 [Thermoplasmata archaeon]|nr:hypothetical protein [Thermoplasmata archaeon]
MTALPRCPRCGGPAMHPRGLNGERDPRLCCAECGRWTSRCSPACRPRKQPRLELYAEART